VTSTNTLVIAPNSVIPDTINKASSYTIAAAYGSATLVSDGVSNWAILSVGGTTGIFTNLTDSSSTQYYVALGGGAGPFTYATPSATVGATLSSHGTGSPPTFVKGAASTVTGTPTGTSSSTLVMMGLGGSVTPARSGQVLFASTGYIANSNLGYACGWQIYYGTGTAPVNGAAVTGTAAGSLSIGYSSANAADIPVSAGGIVTTLTPGTTYWYDMAVEHFTGGTCSLGSLSIGAFEN